jgi:membrane-bound ClpP family serine protease
MAKQQAEIIDFVKKTTEAITVISEATKQQAVVQGRIVEMLNSQNTLNAQGFEKIDGKMDALATMFRYVIVPLVAGILSLVGVKYLFNL